VLCAFLCLYDFSVPFYFISFTPKCFALAAADVSTKLRAILLNKICNVLQFLRPLLTLRTTAHVGQFCAEFCARRTAVF